MATIAARTWVQRNEMTPIHAPTKSPATLMEQCRSVITRPLYSTTLLGADCPAWTNTPPEHCFLHSFAAIDEGKVMNAFCSSIVHIAGRHVPHVNVVATSDQEQQSLSVCNSMPL